MIKITLPDVNLGSFVSGKVMFFADDFKELEILSELEGVHKYEEDKDAEVIKEVGYELIDREFELTNFYDCESTIYTSRAFIKYRIIKFAGFYFFSW